MTIICGYIDQSGKVWLGADSLVTGGDFIYPEPCRKIMQFGPWWLGIAGSGRSMQLASRSQDDIAASTHPEDIVQILMDLWALAGYKREEARFGPPDYDQYALLARKGELYTSSSNGILTTPSWGFMAIGSGMQIAYGAAYVARRLNDSGREVVYNAVAAACAMNTGCGGDLVIFPVE